MKKAKLFVVATLMLAVAGLTGCNDELVGGNSSGGAQAEINLAIVHGHHANAPTPALSSSTVADAIYNSAASYGSVTIIVNDGAPYAAANYDIAAPEQNLSGTKRAEVAKSQANQIVSVLSSAQAATPEVDTLGAISLAARSLDGAQGQKVILILDSGLSTCGYMDFTQNLLRANEQTLVDYLQQTKALPNLSDISVVWMGLGDVSGNQQSLTPSTLESLKGLWTRVLNEAGTSSVTFASDLPGKPAAEDLPYVTPVEIMQDTPIEVSAEFLDLEKPIVLDEKKILFLPDSAVFADVDAAKECLRPIAEQMAAHPELKVVLAGTTATVGSNENCKSLSRQRARAVKELLVELGASENNFEAVLGLGFDHEYHIPDIGPNGALNENAPANRSVIVFDAASQAGEKLKRSFQ